MVQILILNFTLYYKLFVNSFFIFIQLITFLILVTDFFFNGKKSIKYIKEILDFDLKEKSVNQLRKQWIHVVEIRDGKAKFFKEWCIWWVRSEGRYVVGLCFFFSCMHIYIYIYIERERERKNMGIWIGAGRERETDRDMNWLR